MEHKTKFTFEKQTVPIEKLLLAPYNPRTMAGTEREKLSKSIERFGYVEPIVWNKRTGFIVGGNQRILDLKNKGAELVDVSVVDMSLEDEKALNIALNKIKGDWDNLKLIDILQDLKTDSYPLELTGFELQEIDNILTASDEFDPVKEWKEMPEYDSEELSGRKIIVHFKTEKEVQAFAKLIGQKITERTKYIWYPYEPNESNRNLNYEEKKD